VSDASRSGASATSRCAGERRGLERHGNSATGSRGLERHAERLRRRFAVLEAVGENPQRQSLHLRQGRFPALLIGKYARQRGDLCDPATVGLSLQLNVERRGELLGRVVRTPVKLPRPTMDRRPNDLRFRGAGRAPSSLMRRNHRLPGVPCKPLLGKTPSATELYTVSGTPGARRRRK
jgi:hypothetical protein